MKLVAFASLLLIASAGITSCSAAPGPRDEPPVPKSWEPECIAATGGPGTWTELLQPEEITGYSELNASNSFSDGETFYLFQNNSFYSVARLGPGEQTWTVEPTDRNITISGRAWAASPDYLLVQGGANSGSVDRGETTNAAELLTLDSLTWSLHDPPEFAPVASSTATAIWNGSRFVFVNSGQDTSGADGTLAYLSAVTLSPQDGSWEVIPRMEIELLRGETAPVNGLLNADVSGGRVFAWGTTADGRLTYGAVLSDDRWARIDTDEGPSPRRDHDVVAADGHMYLIGGGHIDSDISNPAYLGEIWHYSLTNDEWTELEVPDFVDPMQGVWMNEKLYVFGRCESDAVYDPRTETWEALPPRPIPGVGVVHAAGGRIFISQVYGPHGDDVLSVFIYDPEGLGTGAGGAGPD